MGIIYFTFNRVALVCFTHYKFCFKSRGSSKNIKAYDRTKVSVKFQTSSFQIEDALALQKCEEISGRSPSTWWISYKIHPSVHWFLGRSQWKIILQAPEGFGIKFSRRIFHWYQCKSQRTLGWNSRFKRQVDGDRPPISSYFWWARVSSIRKLEVWNFTEALVGSQAKIFLLIPLDLKQNL
jgi:hypothetical protein